MSEIRANIENTNTLGINKINSQIENQSKRGGSWNRSKSHLFEPMFDPEVIHKNRKDRKVHKDFDIRNFTKMLESIDERKLAIQHKIEKAMDDHMEELQQIQKAEMEAKEEALRAERLKNEASEVSSRSQSDLSAT